MNKLVAVGLFIIGLQTFALAAAPEIDPSSAGSAIALLAGAIVVIRGRRRK